VRVDLPGVDPKEVDISVTNDVLTVKGERKRKKRRRKANTREPRSRTAASSGASVCLRSMPVPEELKRKKVPIQIEAKK